MSISVSANFSAIQLPLIDTEKWMFRRVPI